MSYATERFTEEPSCHGWEGERVEDLGPGETRHAGVHSQEPAGRLARPAAARVASGRRVPPGLRQDSDVHGASPGQQHQYFNIYRNTYCVYKYILGSEIFQCGVSIQIYILLGGNLLLNRLFISRWIQNVYFVCLMWLSHGSPCFDRVSLSEPGACVRPFHPSAQARFGGSLRGVPSNLPVSGGRGAVSSGGQHPRQPCGTGPQEGAGARLSEGAAGGGSGAAVPPHPAPGGLLRPGSLPAHPQPGDTCAGAQSVPQVQTQLPPAGQRSTRGGGRGGRGGGEGGGGRGVAEHGAGGGEEQAKSPRGVGRGSSTGGSDAGDQQ